MPILLGHWQTIRSKHETVQSSQLQLIDDSLMQSIKIINWQVTEPLFRRMRTRRVKFMGTAVKTTYKLQG